MEELITELGAAFLSADLDLTPEVREDHASYIEGAEGGYGRATLKAAEQLASRPVAFSLASTFNRCMVKKLVLHGNCSVPAPEP
ncbi:antirestriction protein ArdC [Bradyrhizobium sp. F1.2.2]